LEDFKIQKYLLFYSNLEIGIEGKILIYDFKLIGISCFVQNKNDSARPYLTKYTHFIVNRGILIAYFPIKNIEEPMMHYHK
jgi:hypothetical protein